MRALASTLTIVPTVALAQTTSDFYVGKTVQVIIGVGPGGGYDVWGRAIARHLSANLPGAPTVIARNMPGGGSLVAASHIFNVAARDGTVLGIIARDSVLGPISGAVGARFDATEITWVGSPTIDTTICVASASSQIQTVDDLTTKQLVVGNAGAGTGGYIYPKALNALLGLKFKPISGFPSTADVILAVERSEVDGVCETLYSLTDKHPDWIAEKKVYVLLQGGPECNPILPEVPFVLDHTRDEKTRTALAFLFAGQGLERLFIAPPEVPPDRSRALPQRCRTPASSSMRRSKSST